MKTIINAALLYGQGQLAKSRANLEIYLSNPVGIGEHADVMGEVVTLVKEVAEWEDYVKTIKSIRTPSTKT